MSRVFGSPITTELPLSACTAVKFSYVPCTVLIEMSTVTGPCTSPSSTVCEKAKNGPSLVTNCAGAPLKVMLTCATWVENVTVAVMVLKFLRKIPLAGQTLPDSSWLRDECFFSLHREKEYLQRTPTS